MSSFLPLHSPAFHITDAHIASILDISSEAIISIDSSWRIILFNKGAETIFGYCAKEMIGQSLDKLIPNRFKGVHRQHVEEFGHAPEESRLMAVRLSQFSGLRKNGIEFPAEASISKMGSGNEQIFTVILRDITVRRRSEVALQQAHDTLEQKVLERTAKLNQAKKQAETANRAMSRFLTMMSHELRTPLNAVIGFSYLMKNEMFGPVGSQEYKEYANAIHDSGQHLIGIINDILDLSMIESDATELKDSEIPVPEFADSVLRLAKMPAEKRGVELIDDIQEDMPLLRADERKLKQVLSNLLNNGIKFNRKNGQVGLRAWCNNYSGHVFQVIDNGIGMDMKDVPKALAPFKQLDENLERKYEGTGLGLPLAKSLVELHGGTLDMQSADGAGTTVTIRFPADRIIGRADDAPSGGAN